MRITMVALGTRGDVQPMIALGQGLQAAGHTVHIVAGENFESWVRSYGFGFTGTVDMEAMMNSENGMGWVESSDNPRRQVRYMKGLMGEYGRRMTQPIAEACQDADLLIGAFVSDLFVQAVSEKYGIPQISALLQPYRPTRSGAASLRPIVPRGNSLLNLWMGYFIERALWPVYGETTNRLRADLGLPLHTPSSYAQVLHKLPAIQGFSRHVVPDAPDWGNHVCTTGYWFLDEGEPWQPPDDLVHFVESGLAPVYIGFGSMAARHPQQTFDLVIRALEKSGQRGIIARGWSRAKITAVPDNVFVLDKAPHGWLFPRVAGVVHHGGAGTAAAGLRAGVPTFIIPHMADQPYWGRRVYELGVGVKPVPRHKLTMNSLANGIRQLVSDARLRDAAARLGENIRSEDGVAKAVRVIERLARKEKVSSL